MTIEEKAKAYDEALKVLHKYDGANIMFTQDLKEEMFPELKESEDERTKKELLNYLKSKYENPNAIGYDYGKWIAWLEKDTITFNDAHIIDSALNDYCCRQYDVLHKENEGVLSFARLQHLAMDIYGWCSRHIEQTSAWKPSNEQMEALEHSLSDYNTIIFEKRHDTLTSLYQDLKKLKEE